MHEILNWLQWNKTTCMWSDVRTWFMLLSSGATEDIRITDVIMRHWRHCARHCAPLCVSLTSLWTTDVTLHYRHSRASDVIIRVSDVTMRATACVGVFWWRWWLSDEMNHGLRSWWRFPPEYRWKPIPMTVCFHFSLGEFWRHNHSDSKDQSELYSSPLFYVKDHCLVIGLSHLNWLLKQLLAGLPYGFKRWPFRHQSVDVHLISPN